MIGAGNLAFHLAQAVKDAGLEIIQVFSRTVESASQLGNILECSYTTDRNEISKEGDLYILSLTDKAIVDFSNELNLPGKIVVHTSGGLDMDILQQMTPYYGVIYPVQTFSKEKALDFKIIPVCMEAVNESVKNILFDFAGKISSLVYFLDTSQRRRLHVAAVFACNFVNHMYYVASEILKSEHLPFDLIRPLILETANKMLQLSPLEAQTGPAARNDLQIIEKHLDLLSLSTDFQEIYKFLSGSILHHQINQEN